MRWRNSTADCGPPKQARRFGKTIRARIAFALGSPKPEDLVNSLGPPDLQAVITLFKK